MDWWKLFGGTFVLIFLAELGDKTQLAALAKTADAPDGPTAKWVVFLGASAALVTSTFIAVFLGHALKALVPDERYIRLAAGSLFLVFGVMILYETYASFRGRRPDAPPAAAGLPDGGGIGVVGGLALQAAMDFEALTRDGYRRLAEKTGPELSRLLLELACEEESHLTHLRDFTHDERCDRAWNASESTRLAVNGTRVAVDGTDERTLAALAEQEEATARFYRHLAGKTLIPSVREVLSHMAGEEEGHAARLRDFLTRTRQSQVL